MIKIWLDDQRQPSSDWIWCQTVDQVINQLIKFKQIDCLSLDNDLGKHQLEGYYLISKYLEYRNQQKPIAKIDTWQLHTLNIVVRQNMLSMLNQAIKRRLLPNNTQIIINSYRKEMN